MASDYCEYVWIFGFVWGGVQDILLVILADKDSCIIAKAQFGRSIKCIVGEGAGTGVCPGGESPDNGQEQCGCADCEF